MQMIKSKLHEANIGASSYKFKRCKPFKNFNAVDYFNLFFINNMYI